MFGPHVAKVAEILEESLEKGDLSTTAATQVHKLLEAVGVEPKVRERVSAGLLNFADQDEATRLADAGHVATEVLKPFVIALTIPIGSTTTLDDIRRGKEDALDDADNAASGLASYGKVKKPFVPSRKKLVVALFALGVFVVGVVTPCAVCRVAQFERQ